MSFHVLGPLEARVAGEQLVIGGGKQRAVLAALLLRAGEVVSVERIVDEVWGDDPPPSATHTIESYVSRLRQLFNGHGPRLLRRGAAGYTIELGDTALDARGFVELQERASLAAAMEAHAEVIELTTTALAMWRGPALADVALASAGRAEADRLEELRLRTHELRFDAELALGRHEPAIGELQALVAQNPYRERFVAQLMLALYRAGRHAEALDVYEQTRRRLDEDLGLQPSTDLQQLSGQIVRQDPQLRRPAATAAVRDLTPNRRAPRRASVLVAASAAIAAALVVSASGGAATPEHVTPTAQRLALVLPGSPSSTDRATTGLGMAIDSSEMLYDLQAKTASVDPRAPENGVDAVAASIRSDGVGVVVVQGDAPGARALARVVRSLPETRFVFVDASLAELLLEGVPNAAAIRFGEEDVLYLAGYLSGLVPTLDATRRRVDAVSIVAGEPNRDSARLIAAFKRGLRDTRPGVRVRVDYSLELDDYTACERLSNRQIDEGSDVVVAIAGRCGLGAVEVARIRGVWAIGAEEDGIRPQPDLLLATHKEWTIATLWALEKLFADKLPMGQDTVLGLEDDYAAGLWFSNRVSTRVASAVIHRCSKIRASKHRDL